MKKTKVWRECVKPIKCMSHSQSLKTGKETTENFSLLLVLKHLFFLLLIIVNHLGLHFKYERCIQI